MKLYLSGQISGVKNENRALFAKVAKDLRKRGHEVMSPVEMDLEAGIDPADGVIGGDPAVRAEAFKRDFTCIMDWADAIVGIPNWYRSHGARAETLVAFYAGKQMFEWCGPKKDLRELKLTPVVVLQGSCDG